MKKHIIVAFIMVICVSFSVTSSHAGSNWNSEKKGKTRKNHEVSEYRYYRGSNHKYLYYRAYPKKYHRRQHYRYHKYPRYYSKIVPFPFPHVVIHKKDVPNPKYIYKKYKKRRYIKKHGSWCNHKHY